MTAAIELFNERGFEETSIQDLASRAGIGKGTIYSYFANKSEIFLAYCEDELERTTAELAERVGSCPTLLKQLLTYFLGEFEFIYNNGEFGRVLMREILFPSSSTLRLGKERLDNKYISLWTPYFQAAQQRGELRCDLELTLVMGHFYGLYIMTVSAWFTNRLQTFEDVAQGMELLFEQAMTGLAVKLQ